ncbi:MAG: hypothetical protein H0W83_01365 [Planctomycetes bacterium]|nr:hypothetical protein [Planctomycetota bacterium]
MTASRRWAAPRLTVLTIAMTALCSTAYGETAPAPQPAPDTADHRTKADQTAEGLYVQGMRAKDEGKLDDAVRLLGMAVNHQPGNAKYRKAYDDVSAMAGVNKDARSITIDRTADELFVKQQQLWTEAQAKADEGTRFMEAGQYDEAERSFQMASIRLETLPFADDRKEPELRRVQALKNEARTRREHQEQDDAVTRNQAALDRQRDLRDMSLRIERDRIDAMLLRSERARQRRDYDEAILLCEQILKINRAEDRASSLLVKCRRERHVYLRQMTADRWDEEHKLLSEQIRTAMLPQLEIIKYTADWADLDARRGAPVHGLDENENDKVWQKAINDQLEQEVTLDFSETDLVDVVAFLQKVTGVNIVLDPQVTAASPPPVNFKVDHMKLRFVLDYIMRNCGLSYVLRNEAIFISNTQGVRGDVFMKLYDVRDLMHAMQSFPGPDMDIPEPGGQGAKLLPPVEPEAKPEMSEFQDIITKVVTPNLWARDGVSIEQYNGNMVITQTADVHKQVEELLRALRNQKGTQIHVKVRFLEVENSAIEEIGVDWNNFQGQTRPGQPSMVPLPGQATTSNETVGAYYSDPGSNLTTAAQLNGTAALAGYTTDQTLPRPGFGNQNEGLALQTQSWKVASGLYASAILHAVEKEKRGNIVFEPDLTMFNGQQAHLVNMNQQSYVADYDVVQTQYDPIITILSYGTVLDVQGIASADKKYITLTLRPTNAQVVRWRRFGGANTAAFPGGTINTTNALGAIDGNPIMMPELDYESVRTSVTIPDGGSLVLAGMTNGASLRAHSGIPFLSHIPFLGRLFSTNGRAETEKRTMILVEANVVLFDEIEKNL